MYQCLKCNAFEDVEGYKLVSLRKEDMENIRQWRNAQLHVLRQNCEITEEEQKTYYQKMIAPSFSQKEPPQILFSYLYRDDCIGYGGLVNLDWTSRRGEVSFLVDPSRVDDTICYGSDMTHFFALIFKIAFEELFLHRLYVETFAFRKDHIKIIEALGFKCEGILREHVYKDADWHDSIVHGLLAGEETLDAP